MSIEVSDQTVEIRGKTYVAVFESDDYGIGTHESGRNEIGEIQITLYDGDRHVPIESLDLTKEERAELFETGRARIFDAM